MKIRRFIAVFLSALILCGVLTVPAAALEDPAIRAKAALLVEADTGTILYDKNIHDELSIASTTKIMSALLIFEAIDRGELRLDQQVTATATALRGLPEDGSTADIVEGETLTVEQLLFLFDSFVLFHFLNIHNHHTVQQGFYAFPFAIYNTYKMKML